MLPIAQASDARFTAEQNRKTGIACYFYFMLTEEKGTVVVKVKTQLTFQFSRAIFQNLNILNALAATRDIYQSFLPLH